MIKHMNSEEWDHVFKQPEPNLKAQILITYSTTESGLMRKSTVTRKFLSDVRYIDNEIVEIM